MMMMKPFLVALVLCACTLTLSIPISDMEDDAAFHALEDVQDGVVVGTCQDKWASCHLYKASCAYLGDYCPMTCGTCGSAFPKKIDLTRDQCTRLEFDIGTSVSHVIVAHGYREQCAFRFPRDFPNSFFTQCRHASEVARVFWKGDMLEHVSLYLGPYHADLYAQKRCLDASTPRDGGAADAPADRYKPHLFGICDSRKGSQHWKYSESLKLLTTADGRHCLNDRFEVVTIYSGYTGACARTTFEEMQGVFYFSATGDCINGMWQGSSSTGARVSYIGTSPKCHYDSLRFQAASDGTLRSFKSLNEAITVTNGHLEGCAYKSVGGVCPDPAVFHYDDTTKAMRVSLKSASSRILGCMDVDNAGTLHGTAVIRPCQANKPSQMWFSKEAGCITRFCSRFTVDPATVCQQSVSCIAWALQQFKSDSCYNEVVSVLSAITNCQCPDLLRRVEAAMGAATSQADDDTLTEVEVHAEDTLGAGKGMC